MDLAWVRDLNSLAMTSNFSRAAEMNHLSQPAFSRRIKALETWVGAELVDRSTHPVNLTAAGEQFLEAGTQALSRIETERDLIREAQAQPDRYLVTFATQHSIGWRFYPAWLQEIESGFGPIMSRLRADDLPNCVAALDAGDADFVIAYASSVSPGIDATADMESFSIGQDVLLPVCKAGPRGRPLFHLDRNNSSSIPYLKFGEVAPIRQHIEPLLDKLELTRRLDIQYENSMAGALRIKARDGVGVAWLPKSLVQPDLDSGDLVVAGAKRWSIRLAIRLHRNTKKTNSLTRKIWTHVLDASS